MKSDIKMKDSENNNELRTETCVALQVFQRAALLANFKKKVNKE